jgi:hypothetical protein
VRRKAKVIVRIPAAQATSTTSLDEILREHNRLLAEELKSARIEEALGRAHASTLNARGRECLRWWDHNV